MANLKLRVVIERVCGFFFWFLCALSNSMFAYEISLKICIHIFIPFHTFILMALHPQQIGVECEIFVQKIHWIDKPSRNSPPRSPLFSLIGCDEQQKKETFFFLFENLNLTSDKQNERRGKTTTTHQNFFIFSFFPLSGRHFFAPCPKHCIEGNCF